MEHLDTCTEGNKKLKPRRTSASSHKKMSPSGSPRDSLGSSGGNSPRRLNLARRESGSNRSSPRHSPREGDELSASDGSIVLTPRRRAQLSNAIAVAEGSPRISPSGSKKSSKNTSPREQEDEKSPRLAKLGKIIRGIGKREQEEEEGSTRIVKTKKQSAFGIPVSTMAGKRTNSTSILSGIPPVREGRPSSPSELENAEHFISKRDEPSAFPGFKVSTMVFRDPNKKANVQQVFEVQAEETIEEQEELPEIVEGEEEEEVAPPEIPPLLSEEELLDLVHPVVKDRIKLAKKTGRLDLSGLLLGSIPTVLSNIPSLQILNLAGNDLVQVNELEPICQLHTLRELDLSFNLLRGIFQTKIRLPKSLTNLIIRNCELSNIPANWITANLKGLDLRFNNLKSLEGLKNAQKLMELLASHNKIGMLSGGMLKNCAETMKHVDLSNNVIRGVKDGFFEEDIRSVERLDLSFNILLSLPRSIGQLKNLTWLDISHNRLTVMGAEFGSLVLLKTLLAKDNRIESIKFSLQSLSELRLLDLSYNELKSIPSQMPPKIRTLILICNPLESLSKIDFQHLQFLSVFMCSGTLIREIPPSLVLSHMIEIIYMSYNQIVHVPSFEHCTNLKILHIAGNKIISGVPKFVNASDNGKLFSLNISGNNEDLRALINVKEFNKLRCEHDFSKASFSFNANSTGFSEIMGLRSHMEDRSIIGKTSNGANVFAVFDGHGGASASDYARKKILSMIQEVIEQQSDLVSGLIRIFSTLNQEIGSLTVSGTTAVVAVEFLGELYVANVGDSRGVLVREGKVQRLTVDHKTTEKEELERIRSSSGVVLNARLDGIIEVTRSLGDISIPLCIDSPHVVRQKIQEGDTLVLACDGVWDQITDEMVLKTMHPNPQIQAQMLRDNAFFLGSSDNLSVICVKFPSLM